MFDKIEKLINSYHRNGAFKTIDLFEKYLYRNFAKPIVRAMYVPPTIFLHSQMAKYSNIYNDDWDMVIILDTCRPDALAEVEPEYDFIQDVGTRWSVGSHSAEWMMNTFTKRFKTQISETAYITSNPNSVTVLNDEFDKDYAYSGELPTQIARLFKYNSSDPVSHKQFDEYIQVWDKSEVYGDKKYPSPRTLTDHTINIDRQKSPKRIIVHYMPPHHPYLAILEDGNIEMADEPRPIGFDAYLDNLRWALNEVEILLNNTDRNRVIITADHGESFSFRRWRGGHPIGSLYPSVRRVPFVETDATDTKTHQPNIPDSSEKSQPKELLESLGYI